MSESNEWPNQAPERTLKAFGVALVLIRAMANTIEGGSRQTPVGKARSESVCFPPEQRGKRLTRRCSAKRVHIFVFPLSVSRSFYSWPGDGLGRDNRACSSLGL